MPIALSCTCGRSMRVKDEVAGKKIRCPACSTILSVPKPETSKEAEDEALKLLLEEPEEPAPPDPHDTADDAPPTDAIQPPPRPGPRPPPPPEPPPPQWKWRKKKEPPQDSIRKRKTKSGGGLFNNVNANWPIVALGVLMMFGAVVWFCVGMAVGWVYFYPPILFISGLITFFKGLMGRSN